ncbi:solute carrier family 13 member 5-like isoform X2 [Mizuhopecten yessoensis]|uniref:solute carrier family 13 member 5-like isoform X2 n=1 Tax=Mizuhopecten yessoensis TaxID=6573 RepID=UPI000B45A7A6|nr:solute carrier family 13 member 5-like isoform X2 [Mizuhopecten yessoensis]
MCVVESATTFNMAGSVVTFLKSVWAIRSIVFIFIAFLAPIGFLFNGSLESRCAYVMVSMAILWLTEALPITATAMMPMFLLPLLTVQPGKVVCGNYFNDTSMLFLGGLLIGVAMEEVNIHRRIAMGITMKLGSRSNTLMFGLMLPTWVLSMWISNTAATAMMLPILTAVSEQTAAHMSLKENQRLSKGLTLSVAYAANVGGIATLTGTPPNLVLHGQAEKQFQKVGAADSGITYANWMAFAFPLSLIMLFLTWFWLQIVFLRCGCCKSVDEGRKNAIESAVRQEYKKLGAIRFGEVVVLVLLSILALLWVFRDLPDVGGWGNGFLDADGKSTVRDSTAAILVATLLFVLPSEVPKIFCWSRYSDVQTEEEEQNRPAYKPILTWKVAEKKVAWGVLVLLGGGFALGDACTSSGLSRLVGCELGVLRSLDPWVMNLILCLTVAGATEITSNTATASLLMPIVFELAITTGIHPLYLMISTALACSFAFMLPVATPPNAIVFSTGYLTIPDMALSGCVMNVLAVMVLTAAINTWGAAIFDLGSLPAIFVNSTMLSSCPGTQSNYLINQTFAKLTTTV